MATRLQPNHTTDNVEGITASLFEGLSYGCGDALIGLNPVNDTVSSLAEVLRRFDEVKNKFFLRMQVKNEPGVLAKVASVFGGHKVSIRRVVQKHVQEEAAELVISTEKVKEYHIKDALRELQKMDSISEISSMIREY